MVAAPINPIILRTTRLKLLKDLNLLEPGSDSLYNRMAQLASEIIGAPVSLMSMVAADRQVFKSQFGMEENTTETPLSSSFCQHVVTGNQPLVVNDAREDAVLKDNDAIRDLGVIGYLGIPITVMDGQTLGSFCVIDNRPREWTLVEITLMQELAQILIRELDLRAKALIQPETYTEKSRVAYVKISGLIERLNINQAKEDILADLRDLREQIVI